jgi:hypothetical protein
MHFLIIGIIAALSNCMGSMPMADDAMGNPWAEQPASFSSERVRHDGQFGSPVQGVGWVGNHRSWAGVDNMVCRMDKEGYVDVDVDVDPDSIDLEWVTDVDDSGVLVVTENGMAMLDLDGDAVATLLVPDVVDGRFDGDGNAVALIDDEDVGCALMFVSPEGRIVVSLPGETCEGGTSLSVDTSTGTVYVATTEGVVAATQEGWVELGISGDFVAWDDAAGVLYVGKAGDVRVSAYSPSGVHVWTVDVGAPLTGLETMGDHGGVLAVVVTEDGNTELIYLSPKDGRAESWLVLHEAVFELSVSASGRRLAVVTEGQVDYFTVAF